MGCWSSLWTSRCPGCLTYPIQDLSRGIWCPLLKQKSDRQITQYEQYEYTNLYVYAWTMNWYQESNWYLLLILRHIVCSILVHRDSWWLAHSKRTWTWNYLIKHSTQVCRNSKWLTVPMSKKHCRVAPLDQNHVKQCRLSMIYKCHVNIIKNKKCTIIIWQIKCNP